MILFLLLLASHAWADEKPLGLTADLTWASQYMTDGFKIGGSSPVWEPSMSWSVFSSGASVMFWSALQTKTGNEQYDELDFMARYSRDFFTESRFAFNLHGFYDYYVYPKKSTIDDEFGTPLATYRQQGNKLHVGISMPNIIPVSGLVPSYNVYYWLYWAQGQRDFFQGGTHHEALLQYYHRLPNFIPRAKLQYVGAAASLNYNDGAFGVHPGWSHSVAQVNSSVFALGYIFTLTVNRQWSYQASVDPTNEFWSTLSLTKEF